MATQAGCERDSDGDEVRVRGEEGGGDRDRGGDRQRSLPRRRHRAASCVSPPRRVTWSARRLISASLEAARPGGHDALAAVEERRGDRLGILAGDDRGVAEGGRAVREAALAALAVAGGAVLGEERGRRGVVGRRALRQGGDPGGQREALVAGQPVEGRHLRDPGVGVVGVDPDADRLGDGFRIAAPEPVGVAQDREAGAAGSVRSVAGGAVVGEEAGGRGRRRVEERRVGLERGEVGGGEAREPVLPRRAQVVEAGDRHLALVEAEEAAGVAAAGRPGGQEDPGDDRVGDGGGQDPDHELRERRVELADAVPVVAGGVVAGDGIDVAGVAFAHGRSSGSLSARIDRATRS